jgi:hypothetical protein
MMTINWRVLSAVLTVLLLAGLAETGSARRRRDNEEKLVARIARERNPVKKAKLEVRLGRVKLLQASDAYDQGDLENCQRLLGIYLEHMKNAWALLEGSGRQASRHPQGFKQLDIALREDARFLEDLQHRLPYEERKTVESVAKQVDDLRARVLRALFPPTPLRKKGRSSLGRGGWHLAQEMVPA